MTECKQEVKIDFYKKKRLEVKFSGEQLSSDGGILLERQAEEKVRIIEGMVERIDDKRDQHKIRHSMEQLIQQRVLQIASGYEDAIDSNQMRKDPILKIACNRLPIDVEEEMLASQATMTRLENRIAKPENKAMRRLFVEKYIEQQKRAPKQIVLDIDGWDAPTHGEQQMSFFHGYYDHQIYYPVLSNEAKSGYPLVLQLRAGNSHAGKGVASILRWLFGRLKREWAGVEIILRGDGGFSLPEIIKVCERSGVGYVCGFSSNAVLRLPIYWNEQGCNIVGREKNQGCLMMFTTRQVRG